METSITRVQSLSQSNLSHVPPQYIQPPHHRPTTTTTTTNIPTINLSATSAAEIHRVCTEWGAFHVTNHNIPLQLLTQMRNIAHSFFNETLVENKLKYACDPSSAATEGYGSRMLLADDTHIFLDWRDYFDHHTLPLSRRNPNHWPHFVPHYREVVAEYSDRMVVLARRLLGMVSESLGLSASCIEEAVGEVYQNVTVSYYPPCPQPELTIGLQTHSDFGAITLLIQDEVEGLQVLKDGEWITVQPEKDAIVVLLADQTEVSSIRCYDVFIVLELRLLKGRILFRMLSINIDLQRPSSVVYIVFQHLLGVALVSSSK
ncbi:hypothetical protein ACFE04_030066 [Oxalis oulophora]